MTKRELIIYQFLQDPLLIKQGYLKVGDAEKWDIETTSSSKMVEIIKTVVNAKDKNDSESAMLAAVNRLLNIQS